MGEKSWGATTLAGLSHVEYLSGERKAAWAHVLEALQFLREVHYAAFFIPRVLGIAALLFADAGGKALAASLLGVVQRYAFWANSRWFADLYLRPIQATTGLSPEEMTMSQERSEVHDLWETAAAAETAASRFASSLELAQK